MVSGTDNDDSGVNGGVVMYASKRCVRSFLTITCGGLSSAVLMPKTPSIDNSRHSSETLATQSSS